MSKRFLYRFALLLALVPLRSQSFATLEANFKNPPAEARPRTFWFWMNGHVTRDGITRDLEAMARVGLGGALIYDGGQYLPKGPVDYLSATWREMMAHAIHEAARLGLDIAMHNAPGWSSSGGPWITPERSMQQLVWTETSVTGAGRQEIALPQPQTNEGYYRDAFVLAIPEGRPYSQRLKSLTTSKGAAVDAAALTDGNLSTGVSLAAQEYLQFDFAEPFEARAITVMANRFPGLTLETSEDGTAYRKICSVSNPGRHGIQPPGVASFAPVTARYFRLVAAGGGNLGEVWLHREPRIEEWNFKANFAYRVGKQVTLPADLQKPLAIDPALVRDLSAQMDARGRLTWDVPAGTWTVLRLGHTSTGQKNISASESGTGLECDKFSREAVEFHFNNVVGKVLGDKAFTAVSIDSYEAGMQNWSAQFPQEFRRRAGYDIRPFLPAMTGRVVGDAGISERFLYDVRRAQADVMAQNYYGHMRELCHRHGLKFLVEGYGQGVFDESQVSALSDEPMAEFWERTPWTPNRIVKSVASTAHTHGKSVVAAESFTGEEETARWEEYPYSLKALGDLMFSLGVNQMYFHRYAHQPHPTAVPGMAMGPWGFHFDRTNTWFEKSRPWLDYLARAQYLLRQGTYVADVLYFVGERPPDVPQFAMPVLPAGYNFDLINAEALVTRASVRDGRIVMPDGASYRMLMLAPGLKGVTPEVMRKLHEMAAHGAVVQGTKPEFSLTLRGYPETEREVERLAADARIVPGADALKDVPPDFEYRGSAPDTALSWIHRRLPDADIYFVANRQRRVEDPICTFRVAGRQPELWQAETGTITKAALYSQQGGRTSMPLHLDPAESVFVVFRGVAQNAPGWISRDGVKLPVESVPVKAENNFTISVWAKPDINLRLMPRESTAGRIDETGKNYVVPAAEGANGRAYAGIAVGRNGVYVVERSSAAAPAVLVANTPVSGWTHVAVVYRAGKPSLYLNGKFVKDGLVSGSVVEPGVGSPRPSNGTVFHFDALDSLVRSSGQPSPPSQGIPFYFEGNMTRPEVFVEPLAEPRIAESAKKIPPPDGPPDVEFTAPGEALVWRSGRYALEGGAAMRAEIGPPLELAGPWQVALPGHSFTMPELLALNRHPDPAVKYFSGTATYTRDLQVPAGFAGSGKRIYLDLGRVEVLAQVTVNGKDLGILWKEPYRVDVTSAVHAGSNRLEIAVTNLWPNRLIGDEQLPPENEYGTAGHGIVKLPEWYAKGEAKPAGGRTTFATWQFYTKDEPLLDSGLLGPVRLLNPQVRKLGR